MSRDRRTDRAYRVAIGATGALAFVLGWVFNIFATLVGAVILYVFLGVVLLAAFDVSLGVWTLFIPCLLVSSAAVWVFNQVTDALIHSIFGGDEDDDPPAEALDFSLLHDAVLASGKLPRRLTLGSWVNRGKRALLGQALPANTMVTGSRS